MESEVEILKITVCIHRVKGYWSSNNSEEYLILYKARTFAMKQDTTPQHKHCLRLGVYIYWYLRHWASLNRDPTFSIQTEHLCSMPLQLPLSKTIKWFLNIITSGFFCLFLKRNRGEIGNIYTWHVEIDSCYLQCKNKIVNLRNFFLKRVAFL